MIAPYFIPRRRVGALRPFKFAIHLQSYGYQPVVLTIAGSASQYTELEKRLLCNIPIIKIKTPFDRTLDKEESLFDGKDNTFFDWIDKHTPVDSWIYLFFWKYSEIKEKVKKIDPDLIWATGDPWSGLWLGEKLSRSLSKPFVADFRDPWTLSNVKLRERSSFSMSIDRRIEKRVLQNADKFIFTSKLTEKKYADVFYLPEEKSQTIYNSFDPTLTKEYKDEVWNENLDPNHLQLVFFGRFRRLSPVTPICNALKKLKEGFPEDASFIKIHSFGTPDKQDLHTIKKYELEENFIFHKPVAPEKIIPILSSFDILLLSTNMERDLVIPAKLWDYLSVNIPIFSITPNPEVGDIIMRSKSGIQVHPKELSEIAELLHSFAQAKRDHHSFLLAPEEKYPDRKRYQAKYTTRELAEVFDELLKHG